jgi:hypothetical protein
MFLMDAVDARFAFDVDARARDVRDARAEMIARVSTAWRGLQRDVVDAGRKRMTTTMMMLPTRLPTPARRPRAAIIACARG